MKKILTLVMLVSLMASVYAISDEGLITSTIEYKDSSFTFLDRIINFFQGFVITGVESSYEEGEVVSLTSAFEVEQCSNTRVQILLKRGNTIIDADDINVGNVFSQSVYIQHQINTNGLSEGTYRLQDWWLCGTDLIVSPFGTPNPTSVYFTLTEQQSSCQENWQCSSWGACPNDVQFRSCTDSNNCGTTFDKPLESRSCTSCQTQGQSCTSSSNCCSGLDCQYFQCVATGDCTSGQTKCEGEISYNCVSGTWNSQGRVDGSCGYESCGVTGDSCDDNSDCCNALVCGGGLFGYGESCRVDENGENGENGNGDGEEGDRETITWGEFYSMSDKQFGKKAEHCQADSECELIEGYDVSCEEDDTFLERTYQVTKNACDDNAGWLNEILDLMQNIAGGLFPDDICGWLSENYNDFKDEFTGTKFCVAESTTWYGDLWEDSMKVVGGLGVPTQYVMIITILLIMFSLGFLINFIK